MEKDFWFHISDLRAYIKRLLPKKEILEWPKCSFYIPCVTTRGLHGLFCFHLGPFIMAPQLRKARNRLISFITSNSIDDTLHFNFNFNFYFVGVGCLFISFKEIISPCKPLNCPLDKKKKTFRRLYRVKKKLL